MTSYQTDFETVENFRDFVEAVEVARDFLVASTPEKIRLALIALDNTAELLMTHLCRELFAHDQYVAKVVRPRFSRKFQRQTLWEFGAKTAFLEAEGIITDSEATLLNLGHTYRNPAFHQGRHNPRSVRALSIVLLSPVSTLLQKAFGSVQVGGIGEIAWLQAYGVTTSPLCFEEAAARIMEQLTDTVREPFAGVVEALSVDLASRLDALDKLANNEWYSLTPEEWDDVLKRTEFAITFDEEAVSEDYRKLIYKITDHTKDMTVDEILNLPPSVPVSREEFVRRETEYKAQRAEAFDRFVPTFRIKELVQLRAEAATLRGAKSETALIAAYRELDKRLTAAEDLFYAARALVDESIQVASDLERGK